MHVKQIPAHLFTALLVLQGLQVQTSLSLMPSYVIAQTYEKQGSQSKMLSFSLFIVKKLCWIKSPQIVVLFIITNYFFFNSNKLNPFWNGINKSLITESEKLSGFFSSMIKKQTFCFVTMKTSKNTFNSLSLEMKIQTSSLH